MRLKLYRTQTPKTIDATAVALDCPPELYDKTIGGLPNRHVAKLHSMNLCLYPQTGFILNLRQRSFFSQRMRTRVEKHKCPN